MRRRSWTNSEHKATVVSLNDRHSKEVADLNDHHAEEVADLNDHRGGGGELERPSREEI